MAALVVYHFVHNDRLIVPSRLGDDRRFFGQTARKYFATIRGTMSFFYTWGSVLGPVIAGAAYDRDQTYATSLWGLSATLLFGSALTALLIKPWKTKIENG